MDGLVIMTRVFSSILSGIVMCMLWRQEKWKWRRDYAWVMVNGIVRKNECFCFSHVMICLLSRVQSLCVSHCDFHLGSHQSIHTSSSSSFLFLLFFLVFHYFLSCANTLSPPSTLSSTDETVFLSFSHATHMPFSLPLSSSLPSIQSTQSHFCVACVGWIPLATWEVEEKVLIKDLFSSPPDVRGEEKHTDSFYVDYFPLKYCSINRLAGCFLRFPCIAQLSPSKSKFFLAGSLVPPVPVVFLSLSISIPFRKKQMIRCGFKLPFWLPSPQPGFLPGKEEEGREKEK